MPNPEFIRGAGIGWQTTSGTAAVIDATHGTFMPFVTKWDIVDMVAHDVPKMLDYSLWREKYANAATRHGKCTFDGYLDPYYIGWYAVSLMGVPTGTGPYVFLGGSLGAGLLTFITANPGLTTYRKLIDSVVTKFDLSIDPATGKITYSGEAIGIMQEPATSPPTPAYATSPQPPLAPWQCVYSRAGAAYGLVSGKFNFTKVANPLYTTPLVAAVAGAVAGVAPTEFEIEDAGGDFDFVGRYLADAGSALYALRHSTAYAQSLSIVDPNTAGTPAALFEMNTTKGTDGNEDASKARSRENIKGRMLRDGTLNTGVRLTLTTTGAAYAAS